jgi:hypothetical protein
LFDKISSNKTKAGESLTHKIQNNISMPKLRDSAKWRYEIAAPAWDELQRRMNQSASIQPSDQQREVCSFVEKVFSYLQKIGDRKAFSQ